MEESISVGSSVGDFKGALAHLALNVGAPTGRNSEDQATHVDLPRSFLGRVI